MLIEKKEYKDKDGKLDWVESIYDSSNILQSTYFPKNKRLFLSFLRGNVYSYSNVEEDTYNAFEQAESQGKFFINEIKNNELYIHAKEFKLTKTEINDIKTIIKESKNKE